MISRRNFVNSGLASAAVLSGETAAQSSVSLPENFWATATPVIQAGPPMNFDRAYQILAEESLDGLILCSPTNIFHATGYVDRVARMHDTPTSFVIISKDPKRRPALVMNQFLYFYSYSDCGLTSPIDVFIFTSPDRSQEQLRANPPFIFENAGFGPLRGFEQARVSANNRVLSSGDLSPNASESLSRAIAHLGLANGRVGIDHELIRAEAGQKSGAISFVNADRTMRRIRLVKSPREIQLMRLAATLNADAAIAAVNSIGAGVSHRELRAMYSIECAKRGLTPVMMQIDTILAETSAERLVEGTAFAIDCLSHGAGYHGDYGRTVFVGEPRKQMKTVTDAIAVGWDAVRERLRPGLRYSDIKRIGVEAIRKSGFTLDIAFTPHSVGLSHTDEPGSVRESGYFVKDDLILEENMVISVDLPVRQSGMCGSAHLEDLSLITRTGAVQINDIANRTLVI